MKSTYLLRLNENLKKKMETEAKEKGVSLNALINIVLITFIEEKEKRQNETLEKLY